MKKIIDLDILKKNAERAMGIVSSMAPTIEAYIQVLEEEKINDQGANGGVEMIEELITAMKGVILIGVTLINENGSNLNKELKIHKELGANGRYLALFFRTIAEEISDLENRLEKIKERLEKTNG